jgi:glycosyltransferase involved in cell wall biosynthesis
MARISIITSVHGTGRWLPEMLASIPWDMPGLEVIVTANGRADWDAVREAVLAYPVYSAILRPHTVTLSDSLNFMLGGCCGEYVMRLDPDDKLPPGVLEEMLAAADATPRPCFVYGGFVDFGERARVVRPQPATVAALWDNCIGAYNALIDIALLRAVGGYEERGYEDWHLFAKLARYPGVTAVQMPRPTLLHRVRSDGRYAEFVKDNGARIALVREALQ